MTKKWANDLRFCSKVGAAGCVPTAPYGASGFVESGAPESGCPTRTGPTVGIHGANARFMLGEHFRAVAGSGLLIQWRRWWPRPYVDE